MRQLLQDSYPVQAIVELLAEGKHPRAQKQPAATAAAASSAQGGEHSSSSSNSAAAAGASLEQSAAAFAAATKQFANEQWKPPSRQYAEHAEKLLANEFIDIAMRG